MNRFPLFSSRVISLMLCVLLLASFGLAQTSRGTVTGLVTDPSKAVVANAAVTLTSKGMGTTTTAQTNGSGIYRFDAVLLGEYTVSVKATGFAPQKAAVTVNAGAVIGADFQLTLQNATEQVSVEATAPLLQTEEAQRGGAIDAASLAEIPISGQNSLNLMLILPGVARSNMDGGGMDGGIGAVNGARARSNNFMIDGSANVDTSVAGPAFTMTNNDAIQEVAVQTSNFTAEFGRSGGAVVNQITKSGTNSLHGTLAWVYRSQVLNAATNVDKRLYDPEGTDPLKTKFNENIPAFTVGGPVVIPHVYDGHNKTFFFAAGQWDRYQDGGSKYEWGKVLTENGYNTLKPLAAACPNVKRLLDLVGTARGKSGTDQTIGIDISVPAGAGYTTCNGTNRAGMNVEVGPAERKFPTLATDDNHLVRIDHVISPKQNISGRWLYDSQINNSGNVGITPAFDIPYGGKTMSVMLNHSYVINNNWINELRLGATRNDYGWFFTDNSSLGATTPDISIAELTNLAVTSTFPQGRTGMNYQVQDTMGVTHGKHALRFGAEYSKQIQRQVAPYNSRGTLAYGATSGIAITGLANFIDDYSGNAGSNPVAINFGSGTFWPTVQTYTLFIQDTWKPFTNLTINAGLRYENFGQPANHFRYPAFVGYGINEVTPSDRVKEDGNNFGPSLGFSWAPESKTGFGNWLFGDRKFVVRGGYQVSYDNWFNNLLSNMTAAAPNTMASQSVTSAYVRGVANVSNVFSSLQPVPINPYTSISSIFSQNIRNPYYHRFSLGVQRELPGKFVVEVSYVGTLGRQLLYTSPLNPAVPNATGTAAATQSTAYGTQTLRLHPERGLIQIRTSGLTSNYNSMQTQVRRNMGHTAIGGFQLQSAWTWSHNLDVLSETFGTFSGPQNPSRSPAWGTPLNHYDYGSSDNDRRHVWSSAFVWEIAGPKKGILGQALGGWSVAPIITLQTGTPFTVMNGTDRDWDGSSLGDRATIGNPNAPINSYANFVSAATCSTRLSNPALVTKTNPGCVTTNDVHWYQWGIASPEDPNISRRNSVFTAGYARFDANILKKFSVTERVKFEARAEIFNLFNHRNYDTPPATRSASSKSAGDFLNAQLRDGGSRTMRMGLKLSF